MSYEDGMPAGGNSRFRGYSARVSERQQLALIMQMTSQEMTSGSSNRSDSSIPLGNVRSSPMHTKSSKSRWSNKNADMLDVNTSYNRQEDRLRLANGCDPKERGEFAGSNSPDEVRTASEAESPLAAGSPAECAATATSSSNSGTVANASIAVKSGDEQQHHHQQPNQEQPQHADPYEMRRTPPQNKVDRQASGQQQQQQARGGGSNSGSNSTSNSARVTLRLNQVRATRDEKKGTSISGTSVTVATTIDTGQPNITSNNNTNNNNNNNSTSSPRQGVCTAATAVGSTCLNYKQTTMESSVGKSTGNNNVSGSCVASSGTPSTGSVSGSGSVSSTGNVPNSSSSSSSSADGGDIYEFKSSKEATPVRGSSSSPNPNPDKDSKDSNSGSLASSTVNMQNQSVSSVTAAGGNATSQGSTVVGSSAGSSSVVSSTNTGTGPSSSTGAPSGVSTTEGVISTSTTDEQLMSTTSPQSATISSGASSTLVKRPFDSDSGPSDEQDEESRKRKKKETEIGKEVSAKGVANRQVTSRVNPIVNDKNLKSGKQTGGVINTKGSNSSVSNDGKSPSMSANSPKPSNPPAASGNNNPKGNTPSAAESDGEDERSKNSDSSSAPKVPPLKIVIPQSTASEQEQGNRNSKNNSNRGHQLPYVVASSNSNDSADKDQVMSAVTSGTTSPIDNSGVTPKSDDKKDLTGALDNGASGQWHSHQRVLRSSHRSGNGGNGSGCNSGNATGNGNYSNNSPLPANAADRSNNSSPQQRHHSPTPESGSVSETGKSASADLSIQNSPAAAKDIKVEKVDIKVEIKKESIDSSEIKKEPGCESSNTSQQSVELHPRKRKIKPNKENQQSASSSSGTNETPETTNTVPEIHPHDQPITNNYQLYLNIRKQIDKKRKGLFPVQPKPPQGFKDYLMNRCTYVLAGNANEEPTITIPPNLPPQMKDIYIQQEHKRHKLRMQHIVEKEKLVLSVEQEILRVHGRAARALANQSVPFSACTFLKDEEVYNTITPEQEEKDRNARSRYNGRLFLSWLQDVDDKWEKIKEGMLLRHHNEAESLHAVQGMDWKWKLKEVGLCEFKATPQIEESDVPMVHVSDDFDLLPA